jgi:hypothetical protein
MELMHIDMIIVEVSAELKNVWNVKKEVNKIWTAAVLLIVSSHLCPFPFPQKTSR